MVAAGIGRRRQGVANGWRERQREVVNEPEKDDDLKGVPAASVQRFTLRTMFWGFLDSSKLTGAFHHLEAELTNYFVEKKAA